MVKEFKYIGKRFPLVDGPARVSGRLKYAADIHLQEKVLVGRCLHSPYAHARITSIDTSQAEALPGVRAILTHKNCPKIPYSSHFLIMDEKCRFVWDEVACVAADNEEIADEALELIDVEYEVLPFMLTAEESLKAGAPLIFDHMLDNLRGHDDFRRVWGDVEVGFAEADKVFEGETYFHGISHATLEPRTVTAKWDFGQLTIWTGTQTPYFNQSSMANVLEIPISKVRVVGTPGGQGFGCRYANEPYIPICCLLAKMAGGTVKMVYNRAEEFVNGRRKTELEGHLKVGVKNDGTITAMQGEWVYGVGVQTNRSGKVYATPLLYASSKVANAKYDGKGWHTNTTGCQSHRAVGGVAEDPILEGMMDKIAEAMDLDPIEFRHKNQVEAGETYVYERGKEVEMGSCGVGECIDKGAEMFGWSERWKGYGTPVSVDGPKRRGVGFASFIYQDGLGRSRAIVKVMQDATVHLLVGTADVGNNTPSSFAMIACEVLGLPFENARITFGDTETCPDSYAVWASVQTGLTGNAVIAAALDAKQQILELAAAELEVTTEELDIEDGEAYVKADTEKRVSVSDLVRMEIIGRGSWECSNAQPAKSVYTGEIIHPAFNYMAFGAQFAEVEVDTETGGVTILDLVAVNDSGQPINLANFENQIYGGALSGVGVGLFEELVWDPQTGTMLNPDFLNYKVYTTLDIPELEVAPTSTIDPVGPFGAKGLGEPPLIPTAPAIMNAVYNAIGVRIDETPITPQVVLKALGKA